MKDREQWKNKIAELVGEVYDSLPVDTEDEDSVWYNLEEDIFDLVKETVDNVEKKNEQRGICSGDVGLEAAII